MNQKFNQTQILEAKGTGFKTTIIALPKAGYPQPKRENDEKHDTSTFTLKHPIEQVTPQVTLHETEQVTQQVEMMDRIALTLNYCENPKKVKEIMAFMKMKDRNNFMEKVLYPLLEKGYIERTIPDKPRSRMQKYVAVKKKEKTLEKST